MELGDIPTPKHAPPAQMEGKHGHQTELFFNPLDWWWSPASKMHAPDTANRVCHNRIKHHFSTQFASGHMLGLLQPPSYSRSFHPCTSSSYPFSPKMADIKLHEMLMMMMMRRRRRRTTVWSKKMKGGRTKIGSGWSSNKNDGGAEQHSAIKVTTEDCYCGF